MKHGFVLLAALALAAIGPRAGADEPRSGARVLTDLDDARACRPLAAGGFAVATGGGLAIVSKDGAVKTLTSLDGLPDTRVHAIAGEGDAVWVGTEAGAAIVSLRETPKVTRVIPSGPVHAVHVSPSGAAYLGAWGAGVLRVASPEARPETLASGVRGTRATAIADHEGALYVAYADGPLAKLEGGSLRAVTGSPTHGQALASVPGEDGAPRLVLGDLEGLFRVGAEGVVPIGSVDARGIAPWGAGMLIGTYGAGIVTGSARGALRSLSGAPPFVRGVGVRGAVRCAATTQGLLVDRGDGTLEKIALGGPPSNDVTALAPNGGRIAVGTFDAGAAIFERGSFSRVAGLEPNESVSAIAWQGARLLLGTAHGLVRVEPDGTARRLRAQDGLPNSFVRAVLVLANDRVLVGTDGGPAIVERDRVTPLAAIEKTGPQPLASPMHATWSLAAADDGTLFVGTTAGLYWGKDGRYERASLASGELLDDWVTALAIDGDDVYAGTYAHGVTRLRFAQRRYDARPAAKQLGGGHVNPDGLLVANGRLHAATMEGLLVRPKDDDAAPWTTKRDASPGRDVTAVRFVGGEMWVASRRGIGVR